MGQGVRVTGGELRADDGATIPAPPMDPSTDEAAAPRWRAEPGDVVGGAYRLERVVGRGAAATVFAATHEASGEAVAVKILHATPYRTDETRSRFMREARAAAKVQHPNIVHLIEFGCEPGGLLYQVLELLNGRDLASALEQGPLPVATVLRVARGLLAALQAVHVRGFVHRDVKPQNVFLCDVEEGGCEVKLLDFGVARDVAASLPSITREDAMLGDPAFMSPEQITSDRPTTARSDIWAVGAVLFVALTGRAPFAAPHLSDLMLRIVREPAPRVDLYREGVPAPLSEAIARALSKRPLDRFESAQAMEASLASV